MAESFGIFVKLFRKTLKIVSLERALYTDCAMCNTVDCIREYCKYPADL